ncbi:MutS-related protein, partial [Alicyclobacillus shizuokensis]|uniref:MutS-related protein n=1 Tax=Alicyclobacillus shizuokensis TaxID=392014 RepID=UPI000A9572AB
RDYLLRYVRSAEFRTLSADVRRVKSKLGAIRYCLYIKGSSITVRKYEYEPDYSVDIEDTFARFRQGTVKDYLEKFSDWMQMSHVDAQIVEYLRKLFPDEFLELDRFRTQHDSFIDDSIAIFDREVQFYVAYLDYIALLRNRGLLFCYPKVSAVNKNVYAREAFDVALAHKLVRHNQPVVRNDFSLGGKERILVVTGPNQGGKTTFARMFAQMHFLASLGCPVPGTQAQLFLFDTIYTHFEREEYARDLNGKLKDDLLRIHKILSCATQNSILIINEIFSSTSLEDAVFLGRRIMEDMIRLESLCVVVTFIDELAALGEQTVSMVSTVHPENPAERTYKIVRKPADGIAYALSVAEKYGLTYPRLKERLVR